MNRDFYTVRGYQILNAGKKLLTSSMEDYLEMICRLCADEGYARINQLADRLHVRPSSATKVVQRLTLCGMIDYERYGIIRLTDKGRGVGEFLLHRHSVLELFLQNLGIKETLLRDTEMIEHDISLKALQNIEALNAFFKKNPEILRQYQSFKEYSQ